MNLILETLGLIQLKNRVMNAASFPLLRFSLMAGMFVAINFHSALGQIRVLPPDETAARTPVLTEVNFENVNLRSPAPIVRTEGVVLQRSDLRRCATCPADPGETNGGNIQLVLSPRGPVPNRAGDDAVAENSVRFVLLPRFVVWEIAGEGSIPFVLRVTDGAGRRYMVEGTTDESPFGLESAYGFRQVEVASFEGTGPMQFPRIFLHNVPPPLRLVAGPVWSTQVNLTWRYAELGHDGFRLERSAGTRSNFVEIATLPPDARSYTDTVETNGQFYYRIRANHPSGESAYSLDAIVRSSRRETNVVLRSVGDDDGTVCENIALLNRGQNVLAEGTGGDAVLVGDLGGNQQCKGFLSFDTSRIPDDATIVSAVLRLTQGSREGSAFTALGPLHIDIAGADGFGGSPSLETGDFEAGVEGVAVARIIGRGNNVHTVELDRHARSLINKAGPTQFRLYFAQADNNNFRPDNVGFFSGDSIQPAKRPVLEIQFRRR